MTTRLYAAILAVALAACSVPTASAADAARAPSPPVRYFTQGARAGSETPYGDNAAARRLAQAADGASLWYEVYGPADGPAVLALHGGGVGSPYEMGALLDALRKAGCRLIVPWTRGHGHSALGTTTPSFGQKVADVLAVLDAADATNAVRVLGFSDGAFAACALAARAPERVDRVVSIGAGTLAPGFFGATMPLSALEDADPAFVAQMRRFAPEPQRLQAFLDGYMAFWHGASVGAETFGAIRCPVLFVAGDEDDHAPIETVVAAFRQTPRSRLCIVPKAWHACFLDDFAATWAAVGPFLLAPDAAALAPSRKVGPDGKGI